MPPILLLSYISGSYGNYVSQQLVKHQPTKFSLKYLNDNIQFTDTGEQYYHNSDSWLENTFYKPSGSFNDQKFWDITTARQTVTADSDWPNMDLDRYNIVFTHWYRDQHLAHLQDILRCRVAKIIYKSDSAPGISDRCKKIVSYLKDYQDLPDFNSHLIWTQKNANSRTEFNIIEYEKIFEPNYLALWAESFK